jgi:hypothetical protein
MPTHTVSILFSMTGAGLDLKVPAETLEDAQQLVQLALQWLVDGHVMAERLQQRFGAGRAPFTAAEFSEGAREAGADALGVAGDPESEKAILEPANK